MQLIKRHKFTLLIGLLVLFVCVIVNYPLWYPDDGSFRRDLEVQYVPTAQQLLLSPEATPLFIYHIDPVVGGTIRAGARICVVIVPAALHPNGDQNEEIGQGLYWNVRVFINFKNIPRNAVDVNYGGALFRLPDGRFSGLASACFHAEVNPGLHIFRIEMRGSKFGLFGFGELFTYSWVYQVDSE